MAIAVTPKNRTTLKKEVIEQKKKKGWVTPFGYLDFDKPVTYNEACQSGAELQNRLDNIEREKNDV